LPVNNLRIYCYIKEALRTHSNSQSKLQAAQTRQVAIQGTLYVVTFFLSYTPAFVIRILESIGFGSSDEAGIFWLLMLNAFLQPLQGFFNMLVFVRPNYIRLKAAGFSTCGAFRGAVLEPDIPKHTRQRSNNRSGSVSLVSLPLPLPLLPVQESAMEDSVRFEDETGEEGSTEEDQNSFEDEPPNQKV